MVRLVAAVALKAADGYTGAAARRRINKVYREHDESHLWPVNGRFNATERAIRAVRRAEREGLVIEGDLDYAMTIEQYLSKIVNSL
jgi:hypothetical protein